MYVCRGQNRFIEYKKHTGQTPNKTDQTILKVAHNNNPVPIKVRNHAEDRPQGKSCERNKLQRKSCNEVNRRDETSPLSEWTVMLRTEEMPDSRTFR